MIVFIWEHKDNNHLYFGKFNNNFNLGNKSLANSIGDCLVCDQILSNIFLFSCGNIFHKSS